MSAGAGPEPAGQTRTASFEPSAGARVSVIIPVYNGEHVLPEQLHALAHQSFSGDWEVVVADNGSSDRSVAVASSYRESLPKLQVVSAAQRRGPSHARNVGASVARGELLLFCDADDVVGPSWVEAMVVASRDGEILGGSGAETRTPAAADPGLAATWKPPTEFRFLPWTPSCNLAVSRSAFEAVGGFEEERRIGEDVDFCWRVQLVGYRFSFVREAFVAYRDRAGLMASMNRRFVFGRAAPDLYLDFVGDGAPQFGWKWVVADLVSLVRSTPSALMRGGVRGWLVRFAGVLGNVLGLVSLWSRRRRALAVSRR